ncbi:O-methyltransferase [Mycena capillaripes]|nr:O-methyltransferase [Mycena capillaripes]
MASPSPVEAPEHVSALLAELHKLSRDQEAALKGNAPSRFVSANILDSDASRQEPFDDLMRDKFIALDEDKCHFMYQLIRATGATNVVEAGTSFGVSTIYLALAVGKNKAATAKPGTVIATEKEQEKAEKAREYWRKCGEQVESHIDLRVGDLLETLKDGVGEVDLVLLDIWSPLALPTLKILQPRLRSGAVVLTDNTVVAAEAYKELLGYLRASGSGYQNMTLPYSGGFEMSVYYTQ